VAAARRYVAFMGGADAVVTLGRLLATLDEPDPAVAIVTP
jgi:alkyl sulfatase BDS1-like metallo-beta-lactamase superfamily hydrolase